jgi:MinD-like ATPase involved in chromosome partitioning or flagellar assembly
LSASRTDTARTSARSLPNVIAIASGKGGVGKTSISVNLGISLAKSGKRVCIFDADTGLANVNILLGLAPQHTLEHVLFGAKSIEDVLLSGPYGLKVIPGANGISECVTLHPRQQMRLTRELTRIESEFDYLILDTAAGIADNTLDFASAAHQTVIVITPEPTSLTDAFSMVKLLHRRRQISQFQIIVNMANSATQAREVFHRFNAAVEKYVGAPTHLLGFLLLDESLRNAVSLQHPVALFPDTDPSSRSFIRLADAVQQCFEQQGDKPTTSFADFWQRQFREQAARASGGNDNTADSSRSHRKPRHAPAAAPGGNVDSYIGELKARLLLLLENPDTPRAPLADLLTNVSTTFQQRFNTPVVDVWDSLQGLIANADRDDHQLRELADRLQPWATVQPGTAPTPEPITPEPQVTMNVDGDVAAEPLLKGAAQRESLKEPLQTAAPERPRAVPVPRVHRYNENRFGSQPALLELLRRQADSGKTALELIDILR